MKQLRVDHFSRGGQEWGGNACFSPKGVWEWAEMALVVDFNQTSTGTGSLKDILSASRNSRRLMEGEKFPEVFKAPDPFELLWLKPVLWIAYRNRLVAALGVGVFVCLLARTARRGCLYKEKCTNTQLRRSKLSVFFFLSSSKISILLVLIATQLQTVS